MEPRFHRATEKLFFEAQLWRLPRQLLEAVGTVNRRRFRGMRPGTAMVTAVKSRWANTAGQLHLTVEVEVKRSGWNYLAIDSLTGRRFRFEVYRRLRKPFGKLLKKFQLVPVMKGNSSP